MPWQTDGLVPVQHLPDTVTNPVDHESSGGNGLGINVQKPVGVEICLSSSLTVEIFGIHKITLESRTKCKYGHSILTL